MKLSVLLAAGVLPSFLAIALVVSLSYYGEYGRSVPRIIVIAAATLALEISASAAMATAGSAEFFKAHHERGGLR